MGKNMTKLKNAIDLLPDIIRWEEEDMNQSEVVDFFQALIDTGLAWELQGSYGRTAKRFIDAGRCHLPGKVQVSDWDAAKAVFGAVSPECEVKAPEPEMVRSRPLSTIAREINKDWNPVYLAALLTLDEIMDDYFRDSAASVVRYFLNNAATWRGETTRRVKAELRAMLRAGDV